MTASRTTPTLCVLVIITGPSRKPEDSTQVVPVISPLPLRVNQAAKTASLEVLPRGWMAVTPVRTGPLPTSSLPLPEMRVVWPTSTPLTSVMALLGPGAPSKGTPRSRARGLDWADAARAKKKISAAPAARLAEPRNMLCFDPLRFEDLRVNELRFKMGASSVNEKVYRGFRAQGLSDSAKGQRSDNTGRGTGIGMVCVIIKRRE